MADLKCFIILIFLSLNLITVIGQDTCGTYGEDKVNKFTDITDSNIGYLYVIDNEKYTIQCCGLARKWKFFARTSGDIVLQVWRKTGIAKNFTLVGEHTWTVSSSEIDSVENFNIPVEDRILVKPGDMIGWYADYFDIIPYKQTSNTGVHEKSMNFKPEKNAYVDFTFNEAFDGRSYAISLKVTETKAPTFNADVRIGMNEGVRNVIYTAALSAEDELDEDIKSVTMDTQSDDFAFNEITREVTVKRALNVNFPSESFTLEFSLEDHCGKKGKGTLLVDVDWEVSDRTSTSRTSTTTSKTTTSTAAVSTFTATLRTPEVTKTSEETKRTKRTRPTDKPTPGPTKKTKPPVRPTSGTSTGQTEVVEFVIPREVAGPYKIVALKQVDTEGGQGTSWIVGVVIVAAIVVGGILGYAAFEVYKHFSKKRTTVPEEDGGDGLKDVEQMQNGQTIKQADGTV